MCLGAALGGALTLAACCALLLCLPEALLFHCLGLPGVFVSCLAPCARPLSAFSCPAHEDTAM